jgi:hypothetical protein
MIGTAPAGESTEMNAAKSPDLQPLAAGGGPPAAAFVHTVDCRPGIREGTWPG